MEPLSHEWLAKNSPIYQRYLDHAAKQPAREFGAPADDAAAVGPPDGNTASAAGNLVAPRSNHELAWAISRALTLPENPAPEVPWEESKAYFRELEWMQEIREERREEWDKAFNAGQRFQQQQQQAERSTPAQQEMQQRRLCDIKFLATHLGLSTKTIRRMCDGGTIPGMVRLGRSVRFDLAVVDEWIAFGCIDPHHNRRGGRRHA